MSTVLALTLVACVPEFEEHLSEVYAPRVVGVVSQPAEAREGEAVQLQALVTAPPGQAAAAPTYGFCLARKPLSELGPVDPACLDSRASAEILAQLGSGASVSAAVPADACRRFGPRRPEPKAGEAAGRPVDPDPTGGYYQPVLTWLDSSALTLGATRLDCGLAGAPRDSQLEFRQRYRKNENPAPTAFVILRTDGSELELGSELVELTPDEAVTLELRWPGCPRSSVCGDGVCGAAEDVVSCADDCKTPRGCAGAETYAYYDPATNSVIDRREGLVVSWYGSDGSLEFSQGGVSESEPEAVATSVPYRTPAQETELTLWAVLRDERGGSSLREGRVRIIVP